MKLSIFAKDVAQSTQAAVRCFIEEHGRARGLEVFARTVGITERRARSLAEGTAGRIDAAEYLAAQAARAELLRTRIARAKHELHILEATHGMDFGAPRGGPVVGRGTTDGSRPGLHQVGPTLAAVIA
ncbi:hypothetical protein [Roseomonas chloroacetimidivorans]|uniref:hypothetical protein n=1 Tax=Roseomonas chloroacetimidivorans TaxID=1766656 RepID=UPI003C70CDE1